MDVLKLKKDFANFVAKNGREPQLLKCSQWAYLNVIRPECHVDFDTGTDIRYESAIVVVDNKVQQWEFS